MTFDYIVIVAYILAFIIIGILVGKKKVKNSKDFATAGQSMGLWTVVGSTVATCMGASIIFGNFQLIKDSGIKGMISTVFWFVGWIFLVLMAKKLRASGASSIPTYLELRFGANARRIASFAVLCMGISSTAAQFKAVGSMTAALNLADANTGVIIGAVVILLFTVFSGLWGVAITDTIQSVLIVIMVGVVIPIVSISVVGGPGNVAAAVDPGSLSFSGSSMSAVMFVTYLLSNMFSCGAHPAYNQRTFAAKDDKTAVLGQTLALIISFIITFVAVIPAFFMNSIFPDITDGSQFVPRFIATYFPVGLRGLGLGILLSLLLTTGDTFLLLLSSTITEDVIRPAKPDIDDKKMMWIGRLVCVIGTVVIVVLALYIPTITELFRIGGSAFGCTVFFPLFLSVFWKKTNTKAITLAMIVSLPLSIVWDLFLKQALNTTMGGAIVAGVVSLLICVVGSLVLNNKESQAA